MKNIFIGNRKISLDSPSFFIAEIGSNYDGEISRAIDLIHLAKECGADAVKFQHYTAGTLVSDKGFEDMGSKSSHQKAWDGSVFEIYDKASLNVEWTDTLKKACDDAGLIFFTSPYSIELVDFVDPYVSAFKLGSGDISWPEVLIKMAKKNKPMLIATGASDLVDVERAYNTCKQINGEIVLMQCNTNYTVNDENFKHINLNVLKSFKQKFPEALLGLSDHTQGHVTVLGAIALGARVIEKHFTDDKSRKGPDHAFAMNPKEWKDMIYASRCLELSLGDGIKKVERNELETKVVQRRSICAKRDILTGEIITDNDISFLRPCPEGSFAPYEKDLLIGQQSIGIIKEGTTITTAHLK